MGLQEELWAEQAGRGWQNMEEMRRVKLHLKWLQGPPCRVCHKQANKVEGKGGQKKEGKRE